MFWLEEPFEPDEFEAYAALAAVDIRIAAGEHEATAWGFRELIERGQADRRAARRDALRRPVEAIRIAQLAERVASPASRTPGRAA